MKIRLVLVALALFGASLAYSQTPATKTEAALTSLSYQSFSYSATPGSATAGTATWVVRIVANDTFGAPITINPIAPAGSIVVSVSAGSCTGLPSPAPVSCTMPFTPFPPTMDVTITTPFARQCAAQTMTIGGLTVTMTNQNAMSLLPATTINGVPNTVPANSALCPTPIPNTPTPTPTLTPVPPPPYIPPVVQNPARGGIFNGSRNDTPTPVRPREVGTAGSTGVGLDPGAVVLRPPSTGDAGILTLRMFRISAW